MKEKLKVLTSFLLCVFLLCFSLGPVLLTPGCSNFGKVAEGQDAVVVNAERVAKLAFTTVDGFLRWEHASRALVPSDITKAADQLRGSFPQAFTAFREVTKAYKLNRSPENKANLGTAMALVEKALQIATGLLPAPELERAKAKAATMTTIPNTL